MLERVPLYLVANANRVKTIEIHDLGEGTAKYEAPKFASFKVMSEQRSESPTKKMLREHVTSLFREGRTYLVFVAAIVWGFIDASHP